MVSKYITTTTTTTTPGGDCGLRNAPPGPVDPGRRMKPATHGSARAGHLARRRQQSRHHGRGSDSVRVAASVSNILLSMVGLRGSRRRSGKAFAAGGGGNGMFDPGGPGGDVVVDGQPTGGTLGRMDNLWLRPILARQLVVTYRTLKDNINSSNNS
ncbi:hypothetical protein EsH8_X_000218 [Colletotrichum jinshuiense]